MSCFHFASKCHVVPLNMSLRFRMEIRHEVLYGGITIFVLAHARIVTRSDMICILLYLCFDRIPQILNRYRNRFKYVLCDGESLCSAVYDCSMSSVCASFTGSSDRFKKKESTVHHFGDAPAHIPQNCKFQDSGAILFA